MWLRAFDIIVGGTTPAERLSKAASIVQTWAQAGATWRIEALWDATNVPGGADLTRRHTLAGRPAER